MRKQHIDTIHLLLQDTNTLIQTVSVWIINYGPVNDAIHIRSSPLLLSSYPLLHPWSRFKVNVEDRDNLGAVYATMFLEKVQFFVASQQWCVPALGT